MPNGQGGRGIFAVISIVTLLFLVGGIVVAVVQWRAYSGERPPKERPAEPSPDPKLVTSSGEAVTGTGTPGTGTGGEVKPKPVPDAADKGATPKPGGDAEPKLDL